VDGNSPGYDWTHELKISFILFLFKQEFANLKFDLFLEWSVSLFRHALAVNIEQQKKVTIEVVLFQSPLVKMTMKNVDFASMNSMNTDCKAV
jgi:hypothetical protein